MGRSLVRSRSMSRAWGRGSLLAHPHRRAITRIQGEASVAVPCRRPPLLPPSPKAALRVPAVTCGFATPDFLLGVRNPRIPPSGLGAFPLVTAL